MSINNSPVPRGETWYRSGDAPSDDMGRAKTIIGMEVKFDNTRSTIGLEATSTTATTLSDAWKDLSIIVDAQQVYGQIAKNVSGIALLPGMLVRWKDGEVGRMVDGYVSAVDEPEMIAGIVDDFLPAAGVPDNDIFNVIRKGPCRAIAHYSDAGSNIAIGDLLVGITSDESTEASTDSGRVVQFVGHSASVTEVVKGAGVIGRALNTNLSDSTGTNVAIGVQLNIQ